MYFTKKFPLTDKLGQEVGSIHLEHLWSDVYGIILNFKGVVSDSVNWITNIELACAEAKNRKASKVLLRLNMDPSLEIVSQKLSLLGFVKQQERIEYKRNLDLLPNDEGSPLIWKTALDLSWTPEQVATAIADISVGDPGHDSSEDPLKFIEDFLSDSVLTSGLQCIHVGFLRSEFAAVTIVQINLKSGFSRISYMGVPPKMRGLGLGKWVHRFSFAEMKKEGGKYYHGGTSMQNTRMIRLFEMHQCDVFKKMEEWVYVFNRGQRE